MHKIGYKDTKKKLYFLEKYKFFHFFVIFFAKYLVSLRIYILTFYDTLVPSDAACWKAILISLYSNEFSNIPPKLRSQNAAHALIFA